jgi:hypothetical protein
MTAERPDSSDPAIVWLDARAEEVVDLVKDTLALPPSKALFVVATALGFIMARAKSEPPIDEALDLARNICKQAYEADRAGYIVSSPNAK